MIDREPEPWESSAHGPLITMRRERGTVTVEALGEDRHRVRAEDATEADEIVTAYEAATSRAHELADQLGPPL
jgi:hypothetical protein